MIDHYENDLVSIITPVFNSARFLSQTIQSVISQTYQNWELILVDDCSTDNSGEIISKFQKENPKIIYHLQEKNGGAGVARNAALEMARGRYIAFLDSDDIWAPKKIENQLAFMQEKTAPLCYTAIEMIDESGTIVKRAKHIRTSANYQVLLRNTLIATSSLVVDREITGDFRMHLRRGGQDYATWLRLLRNGITAIGVDVPMVKYRVSRGSLSSNKIKNIKQVWEIQTKEEKIGKIDAFINVIFYILNAIKKYFL